jgi:hypothetical protein
VDIFGSVWLKQGERGILMDGGWVAERFNILLFAWLRGVEGERFYLRIFQSMCLNFINPSLPS